MTTLERLYNDFVSSDTGYYEDLAVECKSLQMPDRVVETAGRDTYLKIEDDISQCCARYEKFGFMQGFKYAFKLVAEVYNEK